MTPIIILPTTTSSDHYLFTSLYTDYSYVVKNYVVVDSKITLKLKCLCYFKFLKETAL